MAEKYLSQIYYNPESPGSFGGVDSIYRAVKNEGKYQIWRNKIRLWLQKQDTYTLHKPVRYRFRRNRVIQGVPKKTKTIEITNNNLIVRI